MATMEKKYTRHRDKQKTLQGEPLGEKVKSYMPKWYKSPFGLSDCSLCYNSLKVDGYDDCHFKCAYCFFRDKKMSLYSMAYDDWTPNVVRPANSDDIEETFKKAFSGKGRDGVSRAIRRGMPFHVGVISDPLQPAELKHGFIEKFLEAAWEYDYPIIISTKSVIPLFRRKYFNLIAEFGDSVIFQASIITTDDKLAKKIETCAAPASVRVKQLRAFKDIGIRTVNRIQPTIPEITDYKLVGTLDDLADNVDVVNIKNYFMSANRTVRRYWNDVFQKDPYDIMKLSGTPYRVLGAQLAFDPLASGMFYAKCKNYANSLGLKFGFDSMWYPFGDMEHCCGGDGLKPFSMDVMSDPCTRAWEWKIVHDGSLTREEAWDRDDAYFLNKFHKNRILTEWNYDMSLPQIPYFQPWTSESDSSDILWYEYDADAILPLLDILNDKVELTSEDSLVNEANILRGKNYVL